MKNEYFGIDDGILMIWNKLSELGYYTAKGAGFKAKKPVALDISIKEDTRVKAFDTVEELEREFARIRRTAKNG